MRRTTFAYIWSNLPARAPMQHQKSIKFIPAGPPRAGGDAGRHGPSIVAVYLADRPDRSELRVLFAVLLMVAAKLATIAVPYAYKWATDALTGHAAADRIPLPALLSASSPSR